MIEGGAILFTGAVVIGSAVAIKNNFDENRRSNEQRRLLEEARVREEISQWIAIAVRQSRGKISTSELVEKFNSKYPGRRQLFNEIVSRYI